MPATAETLRALEKRRAERLLAFELPDEAWRHGNIVRDVARAAYSHSASLNRRYLLPVLRLNHVT